MRWSGCAKGLARCRREPGDEQGLLRGDWPVWRRFREMRARTSHTYDAHTASEVVAAIPDFLAEADHLLAELQKRAG